MSQYINIDNNLSIGILAEKDDVATHIMTSLKTLGFKNFFEFKRGDELLSYLKEGDLDVLFVSSDIKDMHWLTFFRALRSNEKIVFTPTIFITDKKIRMSEEEKKLLTSYSIENQIEYPLNLKNIPPVLTTIVKDTRRKDSVINLLREAKNKYKEGLKEQAEKLYKAVLKEEKGNLTAVGGLVHTTRNKYEEYSKHLKTVLDSDPQNYNYRFELLEYYANRNEIGMFKAEFNRIASELQTANDDFWIGELGEVCLSLKFPEFCDKVADLMSRRSNHENSWKPHLFRARTRLMFGDIQEAKTHLKKALQMGGIISAEVLNVDGIIKRRESNDVSALGIFIKAISISPRDHRILYNIALCQVSLDQKPEAIESLKKALQLCPTYARAQELKEKLQKE